jgi:hypothetical protein
VHLLDDGRQPKSVVLHRPHPPLPLARCIAWYPWISAQSQNYVGALLGTAFSRADWFNDAAGARPSRENRPPPERRSLGSRWWSRAHVYRGTAALPRTANTGAVELNCSWNCRSCPDGGAGLPTNRCTFLLGTVYVVEVRYGRGTRVPMLGVLGPSARAEAAHAVEPPGIRRLQHRGLLAVHVPEMNRQRRRRCRRSMVGYR